MAISNNQQYWLDRSTAILILNEKKALEYERDLRYAYDQAIERITKEVEAFYGRYAGELGIDLADARKRLNPKELASFQKRAKQYLAEMERLGDAAFTDEYREYIQTLSGRAYISRIEELKANIRHNIETLTTGYNNGLGDTMKAAYEEGFYRSIFEIENAGFDISFTTPGGKQLEAAVKEKWLGENYSDRIWKDKNRLINRINLIIPQEFVRGRSVQQVAEDLAAQMNVSYSNAQRLIRTEINHISNKGTMQAYKESEVVDRYQYMATLDNRTSDICRELDGKVFDLKDAQVGVNQPPLHPYCRSTTIPYFPDDNIGRLLDDRVARDEDGRGKTIQLGENKDYFDWVNDNTSEAYRQAAVERRKKFLGIQTTMTPEQRAQAINNIMSNKEFMLISEPRRALLQADLEKAPAEFVKVVEDAIKEKSFALKLNGDSSYYRHRQGIIVLDEKQTDERWVKSFWHEFGHYIDDTGTNGLKLTVNLEGTDYLFDGITARAEYKYRYDDKTPSDLQGFLDSVAPDKYAVNGTQIMLKGTDIVVGMQDGDDADIDLKLLSETNGKLKTDLGYYECNNFLKNLGQPVKPNFNDYFETYTTPKLQKVKQRPRYKNADADYDKALSSYYDNLREWETKNADAINKSQDMWAQYEIRRQSISGITDTIDGLARGNLSMSIFWSGHEAEYYRTNSNHIAEGFAHWFQMNLQQDKEAMKYAKKYIPTATSIFRNCFDDLIYQTYGREY